MDKLTLPYGLEWDKGHELLRCRICYPAHTYALSPMIRNLDDWLADDNISSFMQKHKHDESNTATRPSNRPTEG